MFHLTFVSCKLGSHVSTVQSDESSFVSHGVTVVRRGEHGDTLPIVSHLVPIILKKYFCQITFVSWILKHIQDYEFVLHL